jgi:UDP-N-acetylmuramoylalanine--D-glutamate ligase
MPVPRAVVAGLGKTGISVVRHLQRSGWQVTATDSRADPPGLAELRTLAPGLRIALGGLDEALLGDVDYVVASPGLSQADPFFVTARSLGLPVIGDIELFARSGAAPVVGITGTMARAPSPRWWRAWPRRPDA